MRENELAKSPVDGSREPQSALAVCLAANPQRGIPQPASRPKPAVQQPSLQAIRIGANPVAAGDCAHARMLTPSHCGPQRRSQHEPAVILRVTPHIELRTMIQASGVVPIFRELR